MKKLLSLFCCLQLLSCSYAPVSNIPQLSYVDTLVANIAVNKAEVHYIMRYQLAETSPDGLYAKLQYQAFDNKKIIRTAEIGRLNEVKLLNFKSMSSSQIKNNQYFEISLILYQDDQYRKPVGLHRDLIWFEIPSNVADILEITLLE